MYALIPEFVDVPGILPTGQSQECDLRVLVLTCFAKDADYVIREPSWVEGWDRKLKKQ